MHGPKPRIGTASGSNARTWRERSYEGRKSWNGAAEPSTLASQRDCPGGGMIHQDHSAGREMQGAAWCMKGRIVVLVICGGAVLLMAVLVAISWIWGIWGK
jgi:hypothetical protein